jgi:hypothetical protein|tara:strand:+ start:1674 stop:2270 length:597 start_codon:yes stop_codon:yes gene_type:complete
MDVKAGNGLIVCLFVLVLLPQFSTAELFLGVTPGDSCDAIYEMEVARGAEPGLPLEEMTRQGMLGFERAAAQTHEVSVYRCHEGVVTSISHGVAFDNEKAQQRYFREQRQAMEERFGAPELDTFNLSLWKKMLLWFEGINKTVESFKTVYWTSTQRESAMLYLTERPNQEKKYVVSMDLSTENGDSSDSVPTSERRPK